MTTICHTPTFFKPYETLFLHEVNYDLMINSDDEDDLDEEFIDETFYNILDINNNIEDIIVEYFEHEIRKIEVNINCKEIIYRYTIEFIVQLNKLIKSFLFLGLFEPNDKIKINKKFILKKIRNKFCNIINFNLNKENLNKEMKKKKIKLLKSKILKKESENIKKIIKKIIEENEFLLPFYYDKKLFYKDNDCEINDFISDL